MLFCAAWNVSAVGKADELLAKVTAGLRTMGAYGVDFEVAFGESTIAGSYRVDGAKYHILLGDMEVFGDERTRYEVDNGRREITVDHVNATSRNFLDNPARAFDFIGSQYTASLVGEAVVRLVPTSAKSSPAGTITLTVDTRTMRPTQLLYDYDGEQVRVSIRSISPLGTPLQAFDPKAFAGYELIDFR